LIDQVTSLGQEAETKGVKLEAGEVQLHSLLALLTVMFEPQAMLAAPAD
jgi:hypothetical protein